MLRMQVPFLAAAAGTRRQLQVEVEFFDVGEVLDILLWKQKVDLNIRLSCGFESSGRSLTPAENMCAG